MIKFYYILLFEIQKILLIVPMKKISFLFIIILISACAIDATKKENLDETKLISSISGKYVGIELKNS